MTLREARCLFTSLVPHLITKALELGYEAAIGEVVRDNRIALMNAKSGAGIANSLHLVGLALDLNLYRDGVYLAGSESHHELGTYWKSLDQLCRWGGDFKRQDGNHYSLTWEGRA